jgi:hypothetical protein
LWISVQRISTNFYKKILNASAIRIFRFLAVSACGTLCWILTTFRSYRYERLFFFYNGLLQQIHQGSLTFFVLVFMSLFLLLMLLLVIRPYAYAFFLVCVFRRVSFCYAKVGLPGIPIRPFVPTVTEDVFFDPSWKVCLLLMVFTHLLVKKKKIN